MNYEQNIYFWFEMFINYYLPFQEQKIFNELENGFQKIMKTDDTKLQSWKNTCFSIERA
jgi:methionyl-tRNA synthetase